MTKWTPEEDKIMQDMAAAGCTAHQVLKVLNYRTYNSICSHAVSLKISLAGKHPKPKFRDGYACHDCGRVSINLEIHHDQPLHLGGSESDINRISLCKECHAKKTRNSNGSTPATDWET